MRRHLALVLALALLGGHEARAQAIDDALVPRGRVRLEMTPVFTSWEERFGRTDQGAETREPLGADLTAPSADVLFPGAASLRAAVEAMTAGPWTPVLGETNGRVSKDITRIEFAAHVGVLDWLTVGAVLPWTRTRAHVDVGFAPDTIAGDLGLQTGSSAAFLQELASASAGAAANATQVCGTSPGSAACASASALASRASSFHGSAVTAYGAGPFFPLAGSTTATSLAQATTDLSADLVAAGLSGISVPMPFATERVDELTLLTLPLSEPSLLMAPLGDVKGLWNAGDMEVSLTARVLEGGLAAADGSTRLSYRVLATLLGRLPTGAMDDADFAFDVGTGEGQLDLEARVSGALVVGSRVSLVAGARYGTQRPRTLVRRVAPPEQPLAPLATRAETRWDPGEYWAVEVAPGWRLSRELTLEGEYRVFRKYRDRFTASGGGTSFDTSVLEVESGVTLHEVGATLRYDTLTRWLADGTTRPLQLRGRLLHAVAGGGGQTPVTTRVEFSVRLFRRLWGSP